jgi:2-polyprenyl-6-methoxyphenol hydroxylase-like FAD-dependent oxidoreductase
MSETYDTDVLIAGAGPAGLVLGIELARRGIAFRLIEQRTAPLQASRGKGTQPRTLEIYEDIGALPGYLEISGPYPPLCMVNGDTVIGERPFNVQIDPTPDIPYPNMLMAPQWRTDAVLRATLHAHGGEVKDGVELRRVEQDGGGVTATLQVGRQSSSVRAKYLVGTDGGRSTVRTALGINFPGEAMAARRLVFGDICVDNLARDKWWIWQTEPGPVGLCPLPHVDAFQLMIPLADNEEPELSEASVIALFQSRTGRTNLRIHDATWLSLFSPSLRLADAYRKERVIIAGDAAHVHPPTGAQGLNTSIQDVYNLGWKLARVLRGEATDALLATYEAERRPVAAQVLDISGRLTRARRDDGTIQTRGRQTQQLDINYRGSTLTVDRGRPGRTLVAGDRAPDGIYKAGDGSRRRVFEDLRGPQFTLLLFDGVEIDLPADVRDLRVVKLSSEGGPAATYGVTGPTAVLVRPDNYIGLFDESPDTRSVVNYFAGKIRAGA